MVKVHHSTQKGMAVNCTGVVLSKTTREREKNLQVQTFNVGGARRSHYLRVCVCFIGHKATCVFEFVFSAFFDNLMHEFFQKS